MKHFSVLLKIVAAIMLLSIIFLPQHISKANSNIITSVSNNVPVIDDKADLFTDYEEVSILDEAKKQRNRTGFQYIIVTIDNIERGSLTNELEYVYNNCKDNISSGGTVLFLIYNNNGSFECELQGYTKARDYIPHDMCDNIESRLNNLDASDMIEHLFRYLSQVSDGTYSYTEIASSNTSLKITSTILIAICCIIFMSVIVFFIIPKKTQSTETILPQPVIRVTIKKDTYIRTHTKIYKL